MQIFGNHQYQYLLISVKINFIDFCLCLLSKQFPKWFTLIPQVLFCLVSLLTLGECHPLQVTYYFLISQLILNIWSVIWYGFQMQCKKKMSSLGNNFCTEIFQLFCSEDWSKRFPNLSALFCLLSILLVHIYSLMIPLPALSRKHHQLQSGHLYPSLERKGEGKY